MKTPLFVWIAVERWEAATVQSCDSYFPRCTGSLFVSDCRVVGGAGDVCLEGDMFELISERTPESTQPILMLLTSEEGGADWEASTLHLAL